MKNKNANIFANRLVKAFQKNKLINQIPSRFTKKISQADKFRRLCESKIKKGRSLLSRIKFTAS